MHRLMAGGPVCAPPGAVHVGVPAGRQLGVRHEGVPREGTRHGYPGTPVLGLLASDSVHLVLGLGLSSSASDSVYSSSAFGLGLIY